MPDLVTDLGEFWAGGTAVVTFQIVDSNGANFQPDHLYMTLTDDDSGSVINSQTGGTDYIANCTGGLVSKELAIADMALINALTNLEPETHRAVFKWTWATAAKAGYRVFTFTVRPRTA